MRKELIWAGIIGISFGLIIAFGAWRINSSFKPKLVDVQPSPTPQSVSEEKITLDKPEDDDVVTISPITVSGITKPLAWIVFSGENGDYIIQSDESGIFSQDVDLVPGINQIKVTLLGKDGNQTFQKVIVVYSSSFQLNQSASSVPITATSDADIKKAVDQKVAEAMNRPKAYLGTVTDIADSTIQIKTLDAQIAQIAVNDPKITVVDAKGTINKAVKLTDIAIGDFIVAMGYVNSKSVLSAQRILITDPVTDPKIIISMSKVVKISAKSLTVSDIKNDGNILLTPDKNTDLVSFLSGKSKVIKLANFAANDIVVSVTDTSGISPILRSVFDIGTSS